MRQGTIDAYSKADRAAAYDVAMDLMHPNRHTMAGVVLEVLGAQAAPVQTFLDLGSGTGFLLDRVLDEFPEARGIALDGAQAMLDVAAARVGGKGARVDFRVGDFRDLSALRQEGVRVEAVISMFALHHLAAAEKRHLAAEAFELLRPGGWFLNADIIVCENEAIERLVQRMRVKGIIERAGGKDERFKDEERTRRYLDELEATDGDQPQRLADDLAALESAGFRPTTALWRYTREVVVAGMKPAALPG